MSQTEQPAEDRAEQSWFAVWGKLSGSFLTLPKPSREECEKLIQTDILGNHYEVRELRTRWDAPQAEGPQWWGAWNTKEQRWSIIDGLEGCEGVFTVVATGKEDVEGWMDDFDTGDDFEPRPLCPRVESTPAKPDLTPEEWGIIKMLRQRKSKHQCLNLAKAEWTEADQHFQDIIRDYMAGARDGDF